MADIVKIKTPYDQAEKAGKRLLEKANDHYRERKESGEKATYQAAKEMATYFVHKRNERVIVTGGYTYCCFDCCNRLNKLCGKCSNGMYFHKKGVN